MRPLTALITLIALLFTALPAPAQPDLPNAGFEEGKAGEVPPGWFTTLPPEDTGFVTERITEGAHDGAACARVRFDKDRLPEGQAPKSTWGDVSRHLPADPYRGKKVEYKAWVRCKPPEGGGPSRAQLWFRVNLEGGAIGFFDNMGDRPITDTQWREYTIAGEVPHDAKHIILGVLCFGVGEVYIDAASLRITGDLPATLPPQPPAPLTDHALANITAFIRLAAYTRFFHPSDAAAATDWDRFTILGLRAVEDAPDAATLAARLQGLFTPIAATIIILPDTEQPPAPNLNPANNTPAGTVGWVHTGVALAQGMGAGGGRYTSERVKSGLDAQDRIEPPGTTIDARLPGGVRCIIPVTLYTDAYGRTMPPSEPALNPDDALAVFLTPRDRSTRLAAIAAAWAPLHHFYPYWEVVDSDWNAALAAALKKAATDENESAFLATLRALVAELHDGHGSVSGPGDRGFFFLPLSVVWLNDQLVVTKVLPEAADVGITVGDVILTIGGRETGKVRAEKEALISGSTQWRAYKSQREVARFESAEPVAITWRRPDGAEHAAAVAPVRLQGPGLFEEPRPANGAELAPGVFYFNLHGTTYEELTPLLDQLAAADGVVLDMRGYPHSAGVRVLGHLTDAAVTSPDWHVRVTTLPDSDAAGISWDTRNWAVQPLEPRFKGRAVFITDASAISYAETCMSFVEHYKLGEIVGAPTAGANGNVNQIPLPGGYTVRYTGMKVLKHDRSQHHTVGVTPTVPVMRTVEGIAAGRDELLEEAVEVARRR